MQALTLFALRVQMRPPRHREAIKSLAALLGPIRVQPGCLNCHLYSDCNDEAAITLMAEWASQADLERYLDADLRKTMIAVMDLSSEQPQVWIDTVIRKTESVLAARSDKNETTQVNVDKCTESNLN